MGAPLLALQERPLEKAPFSVRSIEPHHTPFSKGFLHKGVLSLPEGKISCSLFAKEPKPLRKYALDGRVVQRQKGLYSCKVKKWSPASSKKSLAFLRFGQKEKVRLWLEKKSGSPQVGRFLGGLLTGSLDDRELRFSCGKLGVQHILAVSGLHFGALLACASFFLSLFLKKPWTWLVLAVFATLFFLFLGPSPSVERSYLGALLYLLGSAYKRESQPLNLLGAALLLELVFDPLRLLHVGLQLSFLSVAAILLFYPRIAPLFSREPPSEASPWTAWASALRTKAIGQAFSLTLAVSLVLLPLLLFHFHTFPLLSLVYNLFIPSWTALLLFGLFLSGPLLFLFAPLGDLLLSAVFQGAKGLLFLLQHPPMPLDFWVGAKEFPGWAAALWISALFSFALFAEKSLLTNRNSADILN